MVDRTSKFSKVRELLLNISAGTLATANVCLQLPDLRRRVGYEKNSPYFQERLSSLAEVYAKLGLSPDSDITGSEKAFVASKFFLKYMAAFASRRTVDS